MPDVTLKRFEEIEVFYHDAFRRLRAALGVRAFGMQIVMLPPSSDLYPTHDHSDNGQEEVYVTLFGKATLSVGDHRYPLEPGIFVRVGPNEVRTVTTDEEAVSLLVVGGTPGRVYEPPPYTNEGASLAVASASSTLAAVGEPILFDASGSVAGDPGGALSFAWDFEGTGAFVDTGPTTRHSYSRPGRYGVVLRITDRSGGTDADKVWIDVK